MQKIDALLDDDEREQRRFKADRIIPSKLVSSPMLNGIIYDTETDVLVKNEKNNKILGKNIDFIKEMGIKKYTEWLEENGLFEIQQLRLGYFYEVEDSVLKTQGEILSKDDFTIYLLSREKEHNLYVWAHNTGFDFRIGINTKLIKKFGYKLTTVSTNPFIVIYKNEELRHEIIFLDTFNFFKTSIEALGEFFGIEKIKIDFEDYKNRGEVIPRDLLLKRCINDVRVTYEILLKLYEQMPNRVKFSAAQLSFSIYKTVMPYSIAKLNSEISSNAYHGGRVEVYKTCKIPCVKYDVNSMYPYVMKIYPYPVDYYSVRGALIEPSVQTVLHILEDNPDVSCIADVTLNVPKTEHIPLSPYVRADKKLIFPIGHFRTSLCEPEINFDFVEKINKIEFFKMGKIFEPFVNKYYPLKQSAKGFMREFYKVGTLNSLYGKFGQKSTVTEKYSMYDDKMEFGHMSLMDLEHKFSLLKFMGGECFKNIEYGRKNSVAVASFVTAYARVELYKYLKRYEYDVLYCDTDCFVLPDETRFVLPCSDELGDIKVEDRGIAQFFSPKIYNFKGKWKTKGLKKSWNTKFDIEKRLITSEGERFSNFSESINSKDFSVKILKEHKVIKMIDNKRVWDGENSHPIELTM